MILVLKGTSKNSNELKWYIDKKWQNQGKFFLGCCSKKNSMYDQDMFLVGKPKDWFIR